MDCASHCRALTVIRAFHGGMSLARAGASEVSRGETFFVVSGVGLSGLLSRWAVAQERARTVRVGRSTGRNATRRWTCNRLALRRRRPVTPHGTSGFAAGIAGQSAQSPRRACARAACRLPCGMSKSSHHRGSGRSRQGHGLSDGATPQTDWQRRPQQRSRSLGSRWGIGFIPRREPAWVRRRQLRSRRLSEAAAITT